MKASVELQSETWLGLLGRLLARPGDDHDELLARCREVAIAGAEAGRFLGQFVDRVGELSLDERRELYDETHAAIGSPHSGRSNGSVPGGGRIFDALDEALRRAGHAPGPVSDDLLIEHVLPAVERILPLLEAARNPFALLLKSICFAALAQIRVAASPQEQP